jgi:hypothetical protein
VSTSVDDALAALSIDLPDWYVYDARERPLPRAGAVPAPWGTIEARWLVRLQHRDGALLTPGTGETLARAFWSAIEGARAVERGRAVAAAEPQRRYLPPTVDAETGYL